MHLSFLCRPVIVATCLMAIAPMGQALAASPSSYVLTELAPLAGGTRAAAADINNLGQIVGNSDYGLGSAVHATLWTNGVATDLKTLGGVGSSALAISNTGQILGWAYTASPEGGDGEFRNALWNAASPQAPAADLGMRRIGHTVLNAVGAPGTLVGTHFNDSGSMSDAVKVVQGAETTLKTLGGASGEALAVNSHGDIVGASQRADGGEKQATLWLGQTAVDLGVTGALGSRAIGINEAGQIIGSVTSETWATTAWMWDKGQLTHLEDLGSGFAHPTDINDAGLVVGTSSTTSFFSRAVMWDGSHVIDLNSLLTDEQRAAGWELVGATAINDSGVIIGDALKNNMLTSFVMTPVPEASTYAMTFTGLVLLAGLLWRRKALTR